jgi:hypothetical protein
LSTLLPTRYTIRWLFPNQAAADGLVRDETVLLRSRLLVGIGYVHPTGREVIPAD